MLKTLAFHYLLSVIVAKVFKLNKQDVICRAMLTIKLTGGNGAQGNSR
jgi:predicted Na+-dependent transporter